MSDSLRILDMDQCSLNGTHVAVLVRSMARKRGEARNLRLHVSANRLEKGIGDIVKAIEENYTPDHLVMRMIEFTKEDHFKQLLQALRTNTTIKSLDISKASLPYDAGPETCDALRLLFAENTTLEELDISGEHAHLEVTRFGIGLNHALTGLKQNKTLKVLRIEYQNLGLEGASTLSSVIEENKGLTHIHCEHNDINLQGFTILVNALAKNYTVLVLPFMHDDQGESMKRLSASMRDSRGGISSGRPDHNMKGSVRRTLTQLRVSKPQKQDLSPQDVDAVVRVLGERWDHEVSRLAMILDRNRNIAAGVEGYSQDGEGVLSEEHMRPTTAMSDRGILEHFLSNTTPKLELANPLDDHVGKLAALRITGLVEAGDAGGGDEKKSTQNGVDGETTKPEIGKLDVGMLPQLPKITHHGKFDLDDDLFDMES